MMAKSQAKNKTLFLKYPFLAIFNYKKVSHKQIYNFKSYSYAMCPKLSVLLRALSINNHALLYTHINNHSLLYIHIIITIKSINRNTKNILPRYP